MKKKLTEIIFILDRSGSMSGLENHTIRGFNSFLSEQTADDTPTDLTTILFDDQYEILWDGVDAKTVMLTKKEYFTRGSTALLDAVGKTITYVDHRIENAPEDERPKKVIFVITTDGLENASREYTTAQVRNMISRQQEKNGWEFVFLGANIDAAREAENIGVSREDSMQFESTNEGVDKMYTNLSEYIKEKRK